MEKVCDRFFSDYFGFLLIIISPVPTLIFWKGGGKGAKKGFLRGEGKGGGGGGGRRAWIEEKFQFFRF